METAAALRSELKYDEAAALELASPHRLRHTFAKASLLRGRDVRKVSALPSHASVTTTRDYTDQGALDFIRAYERDGAGEVAQN